ncbi:DUF1837 domain-containing protein [Candidatus Poribacteria bacterium]|jgi:hypothetical protein|nr:DUF1837 domain-containing protein [Candidatus Poribacteria bacterium]
MVDADPSRANSDGAATSADADDDGEDFLDTWLVTEEVAVGRHRKVMLREADGARAAALVSLRAELPKHYVAPDLMTRRMADLDAHATSRQLSQRLPTTKTARSGDLGEILATEYVIRRLDVDVPILRLQWKDGRDTAMRGDDITAVAETADGRLRFLKGEVKSRVALRSQTIRDAATALNRDAGRPDVISVLFVADQLRRREDHALATLIERAQLAGFVRAEVQHLLFTLSGNDPERLLTAYLESHKWRGIKRHAVGLRVEDHAEYVRLVFEDL